MKLLVIWFSSVSYILLLNSKYRFATLFSKYSLTEVSDQVSTTYKSRGRTTVLYILTFKILDGHVDIKCF
jgi:hypothetical protein